MFLYSMFRRMNSSVQINGVAGVNVNTNVTAMFLMQMHLSKRQGENGKDLTGMAWDEMALVPVMTSIVIFTAIDVYNNQRCGATEIELYTGMSNGWFVSVSTLVINVINIVAMTISVDAIMAFVTIKHWYYLILLRVIWTAILSALVKKILLKFSWSTFSSFLYMGGQFVNEILYSFQIHGFWDTHIWPRLVVVICSTPQPWWPGMRRDRLVQMTVVT